MSEKKYIVRLTDAERKVCVEVVGKLKGTGQKVRRAQVLLKADADSPAWTDAQIAEAFSCRTKTVEYIRQRFVELGFEQSLDRKKSPTAGAKKLLDGKVVELEVVEKVSHETVRQTLKKSHDQSKYRVLGHPARM